MGIQFYLPKMQRRNLESSGAKALTSQKKLPLDGRTQG